MDVQMMSVKQHILVEMTSQRQWTKSPKQPSSGVKSTALKQHPNVETEQERFVKLSWSNPVQFFQGKSLNWSVCDVGGLTLTLRNLKVFAAQVDIDIEKFTLAEVDRCIAPRWTSSDTECTTSSYLLLQTTWMLIENYHLVISIALFSTRWCS